MRLSSKAGKPHSYSLSFSGFGRWAPVSRETSIGSTTNPADNAKAMPRNSRIGRYPEATLAKENSNMRELAAL